MNGRLAFGLLALHAGQVEVSAHEELLAARKGLDRPHDAVLLGHVLAVACRGLELGAVGVGRHRNDDLDVVGRAPLLELTLRLDHVLDARVRVALDHRLDPEERLDLRVESIGHELEVAVGRYERDGAVVLEAREAHTLMELDVLEVDRLVLAAADVLEERLVVEAESQLGHAAQVDAHLDGAHDLAAHHVARRAHQYVHRLDHVQEDLVLAVLDILGAPRHGVGDGGGQLGLVRVLVALLRDVLLQYLAVGRLRIAEVHELVEQLVYDDEVVADALLFQLVEVFAEHAHHFVEKRQDQRGICVHFGHRDD